MSSRRHFSCFCFLNLWITKLPMICFRIEMEREILSYLHFMLLKHWKSADRPTVIPAISCHLPAEPHAQCDSVWWNGGLLNSPFPSSSRNSCWATTRTKARQPWEMVLSMSNSEHETISQKGMSLVCWLSYFVSGKHVSSERIACVVSELSVPSDDISVV